ncbi:protein FAM83B [Boleophthalmus pectinirostris]|uniref:protein FAM83B n=1 Tax=Boleophthalmus pectinirostris TaxID=150288 RepID=UPI000A1C6C43|nr:protein FAM83B [Boleophthalmus pectinirostris]
MDSSDFSFLSSLRGEFKTDEYIQPHYKEAYRLAIDRLLSGGRDNYQEFLKGERVGNFLSEEELAFITTNAELPKTPAQPEEVNIQNHDDTGSSSGTYWPMHSDVDTPDLDLGWPDVRHEKLQTNVDLLYHPPRQNNPTIKEVVRKHIQNARQVIAIAMDKFTDVDIFKEIVEASLRGVAVYVLLDHFNLKSFLFMVENQDVRIQQLRNMRVRTVKGQDYLCQSGAKFHGAMEQRFLLFDCCTAVYGSYSFSWSFEKINLSMVQVITGHLVKSYDEEFRTLYARSTVPAQLAPLTSHNGLQGRPILFKSVSNPAPKLERGGQLRHTMEGVYRKKSLGLMDPQEGCFEEEPLGPIIENGINLHRSAENYKKRHSYAGEKQDTYIPPNVHPRGSNWNVSGDSGKNSALDNFLPVAQIRGQPKRQAYNSKDKLIPMQPIMPNQETTKAFMRTWRIESYLNNTDTPLRESCDYLDQLDSTGKVNMFMQGRMRTSLVLRSTIPEQGELDNSSFGLGRLSPNTAMHYSSMQFSPTATDRIGKEEFSFKQQSLQLLDDNEKFTPTRSPFNPNYASLGRPKAGHILTNPDLFTESWNKRHSVADPRSNSNYIHEEQLYGPFARMQVNRSSMGINVPNGGYLSALNEDQRSVSHYDVKRITGPNSPSSPMWQETPSRALSAAVLDVNTEDLNDKGSTSSKQRFFKKSSKKIKSFLNIQDKKDDECGTLGRDSVKSEESTNTVTLEDEMRIAQGRNQRCHSTKSTGRTSSERHRNQRIEDPLATSKPRFTTEEHRYVPHSNVKYDSQRQMHSPDRSSKLSYETGGLRRDYSVEQKMYSRYEPSYVKIEPVRSTSGYGSRPVQEKNLSKVDTSTEHHHTAHGNQENKIGKFLQRMGNLINKHK